MRIRFLALVMCLLIISCKKNDYVPSGLLYKIIQDGHVTEEFSYNKENLVSEVNSTSVYRKFYYDQNLKLIKEELRVRRDYTQSDMYKFIDPKKIQISAFIEYEYDSIGKLTRKLDYIYNVNDFYPYTISTFEYNNEGLILKESIQFGENEVSKTNIYSYDSKGNVIEKEVLLGQLHTIETYEYDTYNNPYTIFKQTGSPGINTNINNIVKIKIFDYTPFSVIESLKQISYEYNEATRYPTKLINRVEYIYY